MKTVLERIYREARHEDIVRVLSSQEQREAEELFAFAESIRRERFGDGIFVRGIVEFSNFCRQDCFYCGLNRQNHQLTRYRLQREEIIAAAGLIAHADIRTVVLQSGEDEGLEAQWLAQIIKEIKERFSLAVTLSVGERESGEYRLWKEAGADRYLLKIETSSRQLFDRLHGRESFRTRERALKALRQLDYQLGSGIMVGLPGQTMDILAQDLLFLRGWKFDMLGIGPFIPHAHTRLAQEKAGDIGLTLKALALSRILLPEAYIPATTALGSLGGKDYRFEGLSAGANVLMPNFTPYPYRQLYEIYPGKRCLHEPVGACIGCLRRMAESLGRCIDLSRADALRLQEGTFKA